MQEQTIFTEALELEDPAARAAFLDRACAGDLALRQRVERLLRRHREADSFPEQPAATFSHAAPPEGPGALIGPYKLLQQIGEGGMGVVFMAEQTQPVRRLVALKVIKAGMDSRQVLARFEAERQALALMDHPNIARVLDADATATGRPYFVMELVKGLAVTKYCDERRLKPRERLELFIPVCQAVQHAHQKGVIHRDLKPGNVLVAQYDGRPVPKVIDFGVAKAAGPRLTERTLFTEFGQVVGTLEYMSPEQAELNQLDIDTRSDIYALGVVLYELLTGTTPLERGRLREVGLLEVLRRIREEEPPTPSTRLSTSAEGPGIAADRGLEPKRLSSLVRGELDWIVMKCLEKERGRRYETANALALDLQRYLADEPVAAGPPGAAYRCRKFLRRNRRSVLVAAVVLLALMGGFIGATAGLLQTIVAREQAWEAERKERSQRVRAKAGEKKAQDEYARAEGERKIAEREGKIAQAVRDFLQKQLLAQADVHVQADALLQGGAGEIKENPTVRELLDRAAEGLTGKKIESQFPGQPLVQAEILHTVGDAYRGIGAFGPAIDHLERALHLRQRHLGADHRDTLATQHRLARAYWDAGDLPRALPLFERVWARQSATLGADHPDTLETQYNLAVACQDDGQMTRAVRLLEQVRDAWSRVHSPDHRNTLYTEVTLANAYVAEGKAADALRRLVPLWEKAARNIGPEHPETLAVVHVLARAYGADGQWAKATQLLEGVRGLMEKEFGPEHPRTLVVLSNLGHAYGKGGRVAEATELLEKVRDLRVAKLGPDHPATLITLDNLAQAHRAARNLPKAIALLEQVRDRAGQKFGPEHPRTLGMLAHLADAYREAGRLPEGIQVLDVIRDARVKKQGADHPQTLTVTQQLAVSCWTVRQFDRSVPLFEDLLKRRRANLGADHPDTLATMANLGVNYRDAGRLADGLAMLEDALARGRNLPGGLPERLAFVPRALAVSYSRDGQFAKAELLYRAAFEEARDKHGDGQPQTLNPLGELCVNLLAQKKFAEAVPLMRRHLAGREKHEADAWPTQHARMLLGAALLGKEQFKEAESLLLAAHEGLKQRQAQIHPADRPAVLASSLVWLVRLYEAWDRPEEAAQWRKRLEAFKASLPKKK